MTFRPDFMTRPSSALHFITLATVILSIAGCSNWYFPESRNRGHIFDESSRRGAQFGMDDGVRRLRLHIVRVFPPGTPVSDVVRHIEEAGGDCGSEMSAVRDVGSDVTVCTYESVTYFTFSFMNLGEPTLHEGQNEWVVAILHSNGVVDGYDIKGVTITIPLTEGEYRERLARQRAAEEAQTR